MDHYSKDEIAQERFKIIEFYEEYGGKATVKAFGVKRKEEYIVILRLNGLKTRLKSKKGEEYVTHTAR